MGNWCLTDYLWGGFFGGVDGRWWGCEDWRGKSRFGVIFYGNSGVLKIIGREFEIGWELMG